MLTVLEDSRWDGFANRWWNYRNVSIATYIVGNLALSLDVVLVGQ